MSYFQFVFFFSMRMSFEDAVPDSILFGLLRYQMLPWMYLNIDSNGSRVTYKSFETRSVDQKNTVPHEVNSLTCTQRF